MNNNVWIVRDINGTNWRVWASNGADAMEQIPHAVWAERLEG